MSVDTLQDKGQSGDVLLFRTNTLVAKAQRFFTRSLFDHVAVFVRIQSSPKMSELFVFEAMGGGVTIMPWKAFQRYLSH